LHAVPFHTAFAPGRDSWRFSVFTDSCVTFGEVDVELSSEVRIVSSRWRGWQLRFRASSFEVQKEDGLIAGLGGARFAIEANLLRARPLAFDYRFRSIGDGTLWAQVSGHAGAGWKGWGGADWIGSFQRREGGWRSSGFAQGPHSLSSCGQSSAARHLPAWGIIGR
jgi:hypothetical protein